MVYHIHQCSLSQQNEQKIVPKHLKPFWQHNVNKIRVEITTGSENSPKTTPLDVQMGDLAAESSTYFHMGGPLCDTWAPKS